MSTKKTRFIKGIILAPDTIALDNIEGEFKVDSSDGKIKVYLKDGANPSASREVVTNSQTQTLTNKVIDASLNTISNISVTMLASGVLDIDLTSVSGSDDTLPSAKAVKTYVDNVAAAQNEASEITVSPTIGGFTGNVQTTLQGHQDLIDDLVTLSGVVANSENLGVFTGTTIPDNQTIKSAIQSLETSHDSHIGASTNVHGIGATASVVGTDTNQTLTNKTLQGANFQTPIRLDAKQDTLTNLQTYALTATNGQIVYATDEKQMFQVVDTELVAIGGADVIKIIAGENLSLRDAVYISTGTGNDSARTTGALYKTDASNDDRVEFIGFISKAANAGNLAEVQLSGIVKGFTGLTAGKQYYLSPSIPGTITLTPPSTNGQWVVASCISLSTSQIDVNPVAAASAIYVVDGDITFTIANNQSSATDVTSLLIDGISTRSFILDYSIYRQTDTALSALAQIGQLRGIYNTQSSTWFMSDDFSGQNTGVTFSIQPSGQIQYTSTNITGINYIGILKYSIRKTFGV